MIGCAGMAALITVPQALGDPVVSGYARFTAYKLGVSPLGTFVSSILAGAVMTILTWLLLAVRSTVVKTLVIWAAGYTLFATNIAHVVVGAALVFSGFSHTSHGWGDVAAWVGIATAGNLVGGLGFVTLFRLVQVWEKRRQN
jgi:formate/nitrite transporter FocA (FNT family)